MESSREGKRFLLEKDGMMDTFSIHNHISVTRLLKDGSAEGELEVGPESLNIYGVVHGGCLATLADTVGGSAVFAATGHYCVTVNYAFNFLRRAEGINQKIRCRATPEKLGRTLCVSHVSLTDDQGVEVANGNFTFFLIEEAEHRPAFVEEWMAT